MSFEEALSALKEKEAAQRYRATAGSMYLGGGFPVYDKATGEVYARFDTYRKALDEAARLNKEVQA